jgi:TFIIF-interacting CTD phosphatase-like protein
MMGTKAYAEEVKKILDPCGVIFGKRVLSRCTPDLSIKLLSKLKLADTTLIVDDTQRSGANTGGIYYR